MVTTTEAEHVTPEEHDPTVFPVVVSTMRSGEPVAATSDVAVAVRVTACAGAGAFVDVVRVNENAVVLSASGAETAVTFVPVAVPISAT